MISPGTDFLSDSNQLLSARPNKSDDCAGPLRKKLCLQNDKDIPYRTSINSRVITSPPIMATGNVNPETLAALHRLAMGKNTEKDRNDLISFFGPNTKESLILTLKLETIDNILKEIDIESIPDHQRTYEHHVIAYLHGYNLTLRKRSEHFEHQTLCKLACWNSGIQLEFVPKQSITPELCEIACRNNGNALKFVPEELITYELCEIACQNHGSALRYVPKHLITSELCKIALQHNISNLGYVPNDWVTPELCEITCRKNGWALNYVPKNLRTPELCEIACRKNGDAFQFVPEELKTPELCEIACQNSISALRYLSESLKTDAFLKRLCSQNLTIITMISKAWLEKNPDICNRFPEAQSRGECHPLIIANLPEKYLRNEQFLTSCDFSDRLLLGSLPEKYRTKNLCLLACRINGQNIQSVPEEFKTETLCFEAIKNGALLKNIPNELKKK